MCYAQLKPSRKRAHEPKVALQQYSKYVQGKTQAITITISGVTKSWIRFSVVAGWQCVVKTVWHSVATHGVPAIAERFVVRDFIALADDVCEQAHVVVAVHGCAAGVQNVAAPSDDAPLVWKVQKDSGLCNVATCRGNAPRGQRTCVPQQLCRRQHEIRVVRNTSMADPVAAANQAPGAEIAMQSLCVAEGPVRSSLTASGASCSASTRTNASACCMMSRTVFCNLPSSGKNLRPRTGLKDCTTSPCNPAPPSSSAVGPSKAKWAAKGAVSRAQNTFCLLPQRLTYLHQDPTKSSPAPHQRTPAPMRVRKAALGSDTGCRQHARLAFSPRPAIAPTTVCRPQPRPCDPEKFFSVSMSTTLPCSPLLFSVTKLFTSFPFFQFKLPQRSRAIAPRHAARERGEKARLGDIR